MKIISKYNDIILMVTGSQSVELNVKYRIAKHTFLYNDKGKYFLYNNVSKRLYLLDEKEYIALNNLEILDIEILKPFIEDWSIVKEDFNDLAFADQARWLYENIVRKYERPNFIIFTTTKCNARCYYCFENGQRRIDMSEKTAEDVAAYIIKNAPKKEVYIKWFGGEPLYNQKAMDIICDRLREAGVKYDTKTTTNGYLFDEETIKKAKEKWILHSTVITLDGTEDVYNKTKNYIYKEGNPFKRVIKNIELLLANEIRVAIRLNIGFKNFENIKELVLFLKEHFGDNKLLSIIPIALYDLDGTRTNQEHDMLDAMVKEIEELTSKNKYKRLTVKTFSDMGTRCMAELDSCKLISPIGELGTCEHFSEGEMMYGSIYSSDENLSVKNYFKQRDVLERCKSCVLYGNCGGVGRCPSQTRSCTEVEQNAKLRNLKNCILATYEEYLENGCETITK